MKKMFCLCSTLVAAVSAWGAGTEDALWRPQGADATWNSAAWQTSLGITAFVPGWSATFDGAEQNYIGTINVPADVQAARVAVGGAKNYSFAGSGKITAGELVKTGAGTLKPGSVFAEPFNFKVLEGDLRYDGSATLGGVAAAGASTVVVGGGVNQARIVGRDELAFGRGNGTAANVNVKTNGVILAEVDGKWMRFGTTAGCRCDVTVDAGGLVEGANLLFGSQGAACTARVSGTVVGRSNNLGVGEGSDTTLELLPGGRVKTRCMQMWNNSPTWNSSTGQGSMHVNGGTIELFPAAVYDAAQPIINTSLLVTYENAITFDIPAGGASCLAASLTNVTQGATAHFVKTGGGDLTVTGDVGGITGEIDVLDGYLAFDKMFPSGADVKINVSQGALLGYPMPSTAPVTVEDSALMLGETGDGVGVSDFKDFQINGDSTRIADGEIQLSPAQGTKGGTAFWKKRVNVMRPWRVFFTYKTVNVPSNPADGFAFFLHNDARGLSAQGGMGSFLCASGITPSVGTAYNIYHDDSAGWIKDGATTDMTTAVGGISIQDGMDVCVTYDGEGRIVQHLFSSGGYVALTNDVNLASALGATTAWLGFSGATGGSVCDQRITNFRFWQADADGSVPDVSASNDASKWRLNGSAVYESFNGAPAFRITDMSNNTSGLVTRLERVYMGAPFKVRGTYHVTGNSGNDSNMADGIAVFFHSQSPTAIGVGGGARGVLGNSELPSATGWMINIYNTPNIAPLKNCVQGASVTALNGINPKTKVPVDFTLSYVPGRLSFTLEQGGKTATASQDVDLAQTFGDKFAYLSISGGTGGANARQYVYNLSMESVNEGGYGAAGYGDVEIRGAGNLRVPGFSEVNCVKLVGGASIFVTPLGVKDTPYTLRVRRIEFGGQASAQPSIRVAENESVPGTIEIGTIAFGATPQLLKLRGAASGIEGAKVKIVVPAFSSRVRLIDLTRATGLGPEDFELVAETPQAELRIMDGVLCVGTPGDFVPITF